MPYEAPTVLVVEDDNILREAICDSLGFADFQTVPTWRVRASKGLTANAHVDSFYITFKVHRSKFSFAMIKVREN